MKIRIIIIFALTTLGLRPVTAQTFFGIKGGAGISSVVFKDVDPSQNISIIQEQPQGAVGGIVFKFMQEKHAGMQFEINLAEKGWTQLVTESFKYNTQLNYLNINAYTQLALGKSKFRLYLIGGPFANYLLSAKATEIPEDLEEFVTFRFDSSKDNKFEFGLSGGGGFVLNTGIGDFQLEGKMNFGLTNIIKETEESDPTFSRNQSVEIVLMYMYPVFKHKKDQ